MPAEISTANAAIENGTFVIGVSFTDEESNAVVPNTGLKWSLTKGDMTTIVNGRTDVVIAPSSTITVVLTGDDLALDGNGYEVEYRYFVIEGTYDGTLGSDLPIKDHLKFPIVNIAKVPL